MQVSDQVCGYDIIGDVHGCADELHALLAKLGYHPEPHWHHPARKAVFVGDIIDRGRQIRAAMNTVRAMVEADSAYLVLGNHEYNAIAYHTSTLLPSSASLAHVQQRLGRHLQHTLQEYHDHPQEWCELIEWLRQQPLCLEFTNFRVVHACWDPERAGQAMALHQGCCLRSDDFLLESLHYRTEPNRIVERLLKGTDLVLPDGFTLRGSDGIERNRIRTKFWKKRPETYGDILFQPDKLPEEWMQRPLTEQDKQRLLHYGRDEKPLFVGHYWRRGTPRIIRDNIACLDYSAVNQGRLVAYRMGPESSLSNDHFLWVKAAST